MLHHYKFNVADYRKDTVHLSPMEHYIYRFLIDWYYLDERPIPKKTESVMRRLGLGSVGLSDLQNVLEEFFEETENGWVHHRIESEIAQYRQRALTAKANGNKGGRPQKPKKTQSVNLANPKKPNGKLTNNHKPITIYKENNTKESEPTRFKPPTIEQVRDRCVEKGYTIDPARFIHHYESNGWHVGKNKMKCWQSALAGWQTRENEKHQKTETRHRSLADDLSDKSWAEH